MTFCRLHGDQESCLLARVTENNTSSEWRAPLKAPLCLWSRRPAGQRSHSVSLILTKSQKNAANRGWISSQLHHNFYICPNSHQGFEDCSATVQLRTIGSKINVMFTLNSPLREKMKEGGDLTQHWEEKAEESAACSHRG